MHVATSFVRNLGGLIRARISFGPVQEGESRTLNMDADEESDQARACHLVGSLYRHGQI